MGNGRQAWTWRLDSHAGSDPGCPNERSSPSGQGLPAPDVAGFTNRCGSGSRVSLIAHSLVRRQIERIAEAQNAHTAGEFSSRPAPCAEHLGVLLDSMKLLIPSGETVAIGDAFTSSPRSAGKPPAGCLPHCPALGPSRNLRAGEDVSWSHIPIDATVPPPIRRENGSAWRAPMEGEGGREIGRYVAAR